LGQDNVSFRALANDIQHIFWGWQLVTLCGEYLAIVYCSGKGGPQHKDNHQSIGGETKQ
jgi:hypothetical protein